MTSLIKYVIVPILIANFIGVGYVLCQNNSDFTELKNESVFLNKSDKEGQKSDLVNILFDIEEEFEFEKVGDFCTSIVCSCHPFLEGYYNDFCSKPKTSNVILFESDNSPPKNLSFS
jgi:hypothetical protein